MADTSLLKEFFTGYCKKEFSFEEYLDNDYTLSKNITAFHKAYKIKHNTKFD